MVSEIKYKHQGFQADAVEAVCSLFEGQPYNQVTKYVMDSGATDGPQKKIVDVDEYGFRNAPLDPALTDEIILNRVRELQKRQLIKPSEKLDGHYNFTIQMETGTGKTYVYIKTILELNKRYGWSKFIVVVPSIAIREGVKTTFDSTQKHFAQDYGKKIRFFIYNSSRLTDIDSFANESSIQVMIINSQAFNATGKDARRIDMELDEFRSRKPIDVIASANPIIIIDEPQSVEGVKTKENMKKFKPFFTLRYSATHRKDSIYNMVYRLDSMDAYNMKLVKRIAVKGMSQVGTTGTDGYVYIEDIQVYTDKGPMAHVGFEKRTSSGVKRIVKLLKDKDNLFYQSGELQEYKNNYTLVVDASKNTVSFTNGLVLSPGDVVGSVNFDTLRRLQIRETIKSHIEKEQELYLKGIKVLSLFFIDEVAKYRQYDKDGNEVNGLYGEMFEEEYNSVIEEMKESFDKKYCEYLGSIPVSETHKGYFSIDKKGHSVDSTIKDKKEGTSDDVDAYDLIMRNKTLLLDLKNQVRFIFSHSALREGWDNPNVFQICTLKEGGDSDIRKLQEVGRGLRLCINQNGERMDESVLGSDVQRVNELTVVASESYREFTEGIQRQIAAGIDDRPLKVNSDMFINRSIVISGETKVIGKEVAEDIVMDLIMGGYVNKSDRMPTEKYREAKAAGTFELSEPLKGYEQLIIGALDSVFDPKAYKTKNARDDNVVAQVNRDNLGKKEFIELWNRISKKTAYTVSFSSKQLVDNCVAALDKDLKVSNILVIVEEGSMAKIDSRESLVSGTGFSGGKKRVKEVDTAANTSVKYDLIGKIVDGTNLTRAAVAEILEEIDPNTFDKFKGNPEEFITGAVKIINREKATMIVQSISYKPVEGNYSTEIFTSATLRGKLDVNMMPAKRNVFDYVQYDSSTVERPFAEELEKSDDVVVYAKIPVRDKGFKICTPMGNYTPDWAIVFKKGRVKHIYFVAETKGTLDSTELKGVENAKIACAKKHFEAICGNDVMYDVVTSFEDLLKIVTM